LAYVGRFAPSPTGPLHPGSLLAALASWLDARAHAGSWLVRIEDVDTPRCRAGAAAQILAQLAACGLHPDAPPWWQSRRGAAYQQALDALIGRGLAYPCCCSRSAIAAALRAQGREIEPGAELPYPGTCRGGMRVAAAPRRAWRLRLPDPPACHVAWEDARLGPQFECVEQSIGDFVLKRADGLWAYQLAVVVDDAAQGVTDVVRGADLMASTARQILLQRALGLPTPRYLHIDLLRDAQGRKLSKQDGAAAFAPGLPALRAALTHLGLRAQGATQGELLAAAVREWSERPGSTAGEP
jgi:glutamyl-Q tRNA(Asp) synthetase